MARYLVVAHQTAASRELRNKVAELARADPAAEFSVLVPATPVNHMLTWSDGETAEVAQWAAESAAARMRDEGANVTRTAIGDKSAIAAIKDELREGGTYDAIVICTFPAGASRWLRADLITRAERLGLPVTHVVARKSAVPATAG